MMIFSLQNGFCGYKTTCVGAGDSSYKDIPRMDETALMDAVANVGPISVAMDAGHTSFQVRFF